jgi:phosphoribosyl 1,2-cyclic phosphodiesterase
MQIEFWGVRGSIPTSGPEYLSYGGNTSCIQLKIPDDNNYYIFDAGTGVRKLGDKIIKELLSGKKTSIYFFISHTHWDHIMGLPFFAPIYIPRLEIFIFGPSLPNASLQDVVFGMYQYSYFPVTFRELQSRIIFKQLNEETIKVNGLTIKTKIVNHPVITLAYRVEYNGKVLVYTGDNEPYFNFIDKNDKQLNEFVEAANANLRFFINSANLLIADSQYTEEEYLQKHGWGHSTYEWVYEMAKKSKVEKLVFFHHDPQRTDIELDELKFHYLQKLKEDYNREALSLKEIIIAKEGECIDI